MGVPCSGCGREYDVALFVFGRTIHCTCGRRVGLEARVRQGRWGGIRFSADAMLGRLARWLRIMGFDTAFDADVSDEQLVRRAVEEDRVILTRDRALPEEWRVSQVFIVDSERTFDQLREVAEAFDLSSQLRLFTRCNRCNAPLEPAAIDEVRERVPPRVLAAHGDFRCCPRCQRIYWSGSHTARMERVVGRALGRA